MKSCFLTQQHNSYSILKIIKILSNRIKVMAYKAYDLLPSLATDSASPRM